MLINKIFSFATRKTFALFFYSIFVILLNFSDIDAIQFHLKNTSNFPFPIPTSFYSFECEQFTKNTT